MASTTASGSLQFMVRMNQSTLDRLRAHAEEQGLPSAQALARLYVVEGLRKDDEKDATRPARNAAKRLTQHGEIEGSPSLLVKPSGSGDVQEAELE